MDYANAVRVIFTPLVWWGGQRYSFQAMFPKQYWVIIASSAESESRFSVTGKIAYKHCNCLKNDAVESTVIYYEGIRKRRTLMVLDR